jgi:hypothetical protein
MTSRVIKNGYKERYPDKDYRDKTEFEITSPESNGKLKVNRNCNHEGDCLENCPYVFISVTGWNGEISRFSMSTEGVQEFIAAFLAIRKEAGLE